VYDINHIGHVAGVEKLSQTDRNRLGRNITKYRARMSFSQEELAGRAAIEPRYLQKIEAGEFGGSMAVLKRIKRELKIDWNDLLAGL
jgi:transcriptional regulator with XRE-family HTH domain